MPPTCSLGRRKPGIVLPQFSLSPLLSLLPVPLIDVAQRDELSREEGKEENESKRPDRLSSVPFM